MPAKTFGRREFLAGLAAGAAAAAVPGPIPRAEAAGRSRRSIAGAGAASSGLAEPAFRPLPLGSVLPEGWLLRQLRIQAAGLTGHLDEFWPDVRDSRWVGGTVDSWERAPYWLDGAIPLAWLVDERALKDRIAGHVGRILEGQKADGSYRSAWPDDGGGGHDLWDVLLAGKMLVQYHEATGDDRVLRSVVRNLRWLAAELDRRPLFDWGRYRWFEGLIPAFYAYERTGEPWLLDLGRALRAQGFDYRAFYAGEDATSPTPRRGLWTWAKHVVNTGMAVKASALAWRLSRAEEDRAFPARMIALLDRYHGQVTGMFTGDECLAGRNPVQGTELCAVVEFLYSLEHLLSLTGEAAFGDRLERVAFNALPATFAPDMWSHQYDQQVNQVQCTLNPDHMWTTNGPESNLFGLEPNFGCCTANMHQGWPKLAAHLWMKAPGGGIAAVAYAPSSARFEASGTPVRMVCETGYPFREDLTVRVEASRAVRFPLLLRVPAWAAGATARLPGEGERRLEPGTFFRAEREWRDGDIVSLHYPMTGRTSVRYNGAVAIERGPLVYALEPGATWTRINADKPFRELPHGDFEVRPSKPWNYGLVLDAAKPGGGVRFEERPIGETPFSPEGPGMAARVNARRVPEWKLVHGWAAEAPPEPDASGQPLEEITLIPYGCAKVRVTEFPPLGT